MEGLAVASLGLGEPALVLEQGAQVVVGASVIGFEAQGLLVASLGLGGLAEGAVDLPQVEVVGGLAGVQLEGLANVLQGGDVLSAGISQDADQVPGVGMVGFRLEDLPVDRLGVLQPAGSMVLQGRLK